MSLARILAMMAARKRAEFIGWAHGGEFATTASLPAGAKAGDLMVITYYDGATISGGSGTAFNTYSFTNTKVSFRVIEPGDLVNAINFSRTTPSITGVFRGPTSLSASVSNGNLTASHTTNVTGITPSANCIGIFGAASTATGVPTYQIPPNGPMEQSSSRTTSGLGYGTGALVGIESYTPGTAFPVAADDAGKAYIYELLV